MKKFDSFWLSALIGLVLPPIFAYFFMKTFYHGGLPLADAILGMQKTALFTKLTIVALLPNLFAAFIAYTAQRWRMCRGFIVMVLLYMAVSLFFM